MRGALVVAALTVVKLHTVGLVEDKAVAMLGLFALDGVNVGPGRVDLEETDLALDGVVGALDIEMARDCVVALALHNAVGELQVVRRSRAAAAARPRLGHPPARNEKLIFG